MIRAKHRPYKLHRSKQKRRHLAAFFGKKPEKYLGLFLGVFLAEFLHPACGVQHLLLAGEERMTLRTYFNVQIAAHGGARFELVAATASN
jgi:hypothetical protein